jgi:glyoxylase-like metal-dependent hydrolase (beta-lactamase superfamily II)
LCNFFALEGKYKIEKYNLIYSSDIDLSGFGPWYGNPTSDLDQFRLSIRRLRDMKPEILLNGHSKPLTKNIDQKLVLYEAAIDKRDQAILAVLKKEPATLEQIIDKKLIYRRHYGQEVLRFFEEQMIQKHLESLLKRKMIVRTEEGLFMPL